MVSRTASWGLFLCAVWFGPPSTSGNTISGNPTPHSRTIVAVKGDTAVLRCDEGSLSSKLYSLKWYKGNKEFFRYTPKSKPVYTEFPIPRHRVLMSLSNSTQLVFANVTRDYSGNYTCETTAESPSFLTKVFETSLQVIEVPQRDVSITGTHPRYRVNDTLSANCTCEKSYPAANLTWFVNGKPEKLHVQTHRPIEFPSARGPLFTAHSTLKMLVHHWMFEDNHLKIRCVATIYNHYSNSYESSIAMKRKKPKPTMATTTTVTAIVVVDVVDKSESKWTKLFRAMLSNSSESALQGSLVMLVRLMGCLQIAFVLR